LEKVFEKIMLKGEELTGIKRKLFFWSVDVAQQYDNLVPGSWWYNLKLKIANKIIFGKWRVALGGNVKFIVTGGAIKLTSRMGEHEDTNKELEKLEKVRDFLKKLFKLLFF